MWDFTILISLKFTTIIIFFPFFTPISDIMCYIFLTTLIGAGDNPWLKNFWKKGPGKLVSDEVLLEHNLDYWWSIYWPQTSIIHLKARPHQKPICQGLFFKFFSTKGCLQAQSMFSEKYSAWCLKLGSKSGKMLFWWKMAS